MEDKPKKAKGIRKADLSAELVEFIKTPVNEPANSTEIPEPADMRQRRELWASLPDRAGQPQQEGPKIGSEKAPERRIGPRNPKHPNVNNDQGGRNPT